MFLYLIVLSISNITDEYLSIETTRVLIQCIYICIYKFRQISLPVLCSQLGFYVVVFYNSFWHNDKLNNL